MPSSASIDEEPRKRRRIDGNDDGKHNETDAAMQDHLGEDVENDARANRSPRGDGNDDDTNGIPETNPAPPPLHRKRMDPLSEAMGGCVNVQLVEPWLREYQVLPQRTHPNMNMSGTGGYMLSATYVGDGFEFATVEDAQ